MKSRIAIIWIVLYVLVGIYLYITRGELRPDFFAAIAIFLMIIFVKIKKFELTAPAVLFLGLATMPHLIGIFPIETAEGVFTVYGSGFLEGNYDMLAHFIGCFFLALSLLNLFYHNYPKASKLGILLIFLAVLGIGSMLEMSEYIGYKVWGFGEGVFQFGEGDNSDAFGPWGDSSTDMIANLDGTAVAFIAYHLIRRLRKVQTIKNINT